MQSFFEEKYGLSYRAEDEIIITIDASEALDADFRTILEEEDEVVVFAPAYPGYIPLIVLCGPRPVSVDTSANVFKTDLELLKQSLPIKRKRFYFTIHPIQPELYYKRGDGNSSRMAKGTGLICYF
ncbi:aminotransferase class I and II [Cytobacillus oceanisediminis]|uniref:Aminotransferase class I and II n=1 Tax=Cytobacillus oceanisediminis TaxID=665099 RepID=A0A2V3A8V6_9BACI|nr:aminotransferase class I and II [Cytobacillus oceanisediminis]